MITWPDRLVQEIARRRCIGFLGAGVSRHAKNASGERPPLWRSFLDQALTRCGPPHAEIKRLLRGGDYLTACQLIKSKLGDHDWHDLLEEVFAKPNYQGSEIHEHIFSLDLPIIATTNIDQIYDRYLSSKYGGVVVSKAYHDDAVGRYIKGDPKTRLVLKVHGSVENPEKAVFTREQYADARNGHSTFFETLSALIITQTFLFLGYGLSDPDIQLLLENNARLFRSQTPHFFVTPDRPSAELADMFSRNYSIKILRYSDKNNHEELSKSLEQLALQVGTARQSMASSQLW